MWQFWATTRESESERESSAANADVASKEMDDTQQSNKHVARMSF
jgi:hypothetical protein